MQEKLLQGLTSTAFEPVPREIPATRTDEQILTELLRVSVVVASSHTASILAAAEVLRVSSKDIVGLNPEHAVLGRQEQIQEPRSNFPLVPTAFKLEQIRSYYIDVHLQQLMNESLAHDASAWKHAVPTLRIGEIESFLAEAAQARAERYANERLVLASDVVVKVNGQDLHSYQRHNKPDSEASQLKEKAEVFGTILNDLKERHRQPATIEWDCAFGMSFDGKTKMSQLTISTELPALPVDDPTFAFLLGIHVDPRVSGGLKLLELLEYLPETTLTIRNSGEPEEEGVIILPEDARGLIVNKVLPARLYSQMLVNDFLQINLDGKHIGKDGQLIPLQLVFLDLAHPSEI